MVLCLGLEPAPPVLRQAPRQAKASGHDASLFFFTDEIPLFGLFLFLFHFRNKIEGWQTNREVVNNQQVSKSNDYSTAKQVFGLVGTACYAAEVLDLDLAKAINLLSEHASIARDASTRGSWHHRCSLSGRAVNEALDLLTAAKTNTPVHVTRGRRPAQAARTITIFFDASAWGWGAMVIDNGRLTQYSHQGTEADRNGNDVLSSVTAEPLAIRRILCSIPIANAHVILNTDHEGMVWASAKPYSLTASYNAVFQLRNELAASGTTIEFSWIPGHTNPADHLSRGVPPILQVTSIGTCSLG